MPPLTIKAIVNAPIEKVWATWTEPAHITQWAFASNDWEAPYAENDVRVGGKFTTRMQAKDGSAGFDFEGTYTAVTPLQHIAYRMADGRKVSIDFEQQSDGVHITETFDPEHENAEAMQRAGWQSILDNFKKHVEAK